MPDLTVFTESFSGSLKASDVRSSSGIETPSVKMTKSVGSLRPGQNELEKLNTQSFSSNVASTRTFEFNDPVKAKGLPDTPPGSFSNATITSNLIAAISMSLVHSLSTKQDLSPIGTRSCIGSLTSQRNEIWLDRLQLGMSLKSILVRWSPSGTLTISFFQTMIPWLQRVSEIPADGLQDPSMAMIRKVIISPSGKIFHYSRELEMQTPSSYSALTASYRQPDRLIELKKSIANHLALQGIHVTHEEQWLQLHSVTSQPADRKVEGSRQDMPADSFLWPAKLCFYKLESSVHRKTSSHDRISEDTEHHPLIYAESWFKAKAKREMALEAQRKEDERSAQRLQESPEADVEENLSDFVPRTTQYLSTQDASGIYPTPPDGLRSQAVGLPVNPDTQAQASEFIGKENPDSAEGNGIVAGSPFGDALDPDVTSARYEEPDDGDLFGDMHSSLFAANGLTEADFSFFDEPRIDGDLDLPLDLEKTSAGFASREVPDLSLLSDCDILNEGAVQKKSGGSTAGDGSASKESKAKPGTDFSASLTLKYSPGRIRLASLIFDDHVVSIDGVVDDPVSLKPSRSISSYEGPLTPVIDSSGESTLPEGESKVSFGSVLFREKLREFDNKYVTQGRFGYDLEAVPSSPRLKEQNERMIPKVGLAHEDDLESYETSETSPDEGSTIPICSACLKSNAVIAPDDTFDGAATDVSNPTHDDDMSKAMEDAETPGSRKRKRDQEESIIHPVTPQFSDSSVAADDSKGEENISYPPVDIFVRNSGTFLEETPSFWSQILDSNMSSYHGRHPSLGPVDRTFMQVAQILADQLILQTEPSSENPHYSDVLNQQAPCRESNHDQSAFRDTVLRFFPRSELCNLGQYINAEKENDILGTVSRQPQKEKAILSTPKGTGVSRNSPMKLRTPYTCVRRNQTRMDLLAPALHFWEELGLGPAHESKEVTAFYIFPASKNIQNGVEMFSKMMGNTYQDCKLGTHDEVSDSNGFISGLVPVSMHGDQAAGRIDEKLRKACEKLGKILSVTNLLQLTCLQALILHN